MLEFSNVFFELLTFFISPFNNTLLCRRLNYELCQLENNVIDVYRKRGEGKKEVREVITFILLLI